MLTPDEKQNYNAQMRKVFAKLRAYYKAGVTGQYDEALALGVELESLVLQASQIVYAARHDSEMREAMHKGFQLYIDDAGQAYTVKRQGRGDR